MAKKKITMVVALFLSFLPFSIFSSCDKDTNCYLEVHVLDEATREPVSGVSIKVFQNGGTLHGEGVTGSDGVYKLSFKWPAILSITAELDTGQGYRKGETSVRTKAGEVTAANVTLSTQVY